MFNAQTKLAFKVGRIVEQTVREFCNKVAYRVVLLHSFRTQSRVSEPPLLFPFFSILEQRHALR